MTTHRLVALTVCVAVTGCWTAGALASTTPPSVDLPRSIEYAGTEWTIDSAAFHPSAADTPPTVRLGFSVVNQLDSYSISVPTELLALTLPDGVLVRAAELDGTPSPYHVDLDPGSSATGTAVFELGTDRVEPDLAASSFVIDEPGRTPATLPLAGPRPPDRFPIVAAATGASGPVAGTCGPDERVDLAVTGATEALDLGPNRAAVDSAYVSIDLRITALVGPLGWACIDGAFLRLAAGDAVVEPVSGTEVSESVDVGTTVDVTVAFAVPLTITEFELRVGADGATDATIPISFTASAAQAELPDPSTPTSK